VGASALVLLLMQMRCHVLFPRAAIAWLVAWLCLATVGGEGGSTWSEGGCIIDGALSALVIVLALYLEFSPRVRHTFADRQVAVSA
jgi:hypothetical protein